MNIIKILNDINTMHNMKNYINLIMNDITTKIKSDFVPFETVINQFIDDVKLHPTNDNSFWEPQIETYKLNYNRKMTLETNDDITCEIQYMLPIYKKNFPQIRGALTFKFVIMTFTDSKNNNKIILEIKKLYPDKDYNKFGHKGLTEYTNNILKYYNGDEKTIYDYIQTIIINNKPRFFSDIDEYYEVITYCLKQLVEKGILYNVVIADYRLSSFHKQLESYGFKKESFNIKANVKEPSWFAELLLFQPT